jgi:hypothetical protein
MIIAGYIDPISIDRSRTGLTTAFSRGPPHMGGCICGVISFFGDGYMIDDTLYYLNSRRTKCIRYAQT